MDKKITLATVKSFIRKNRDNLLIRTQSTFDGMTDCVQSTGNREFSQARASDHAHDNNMGIAGVWFVFGSRDLFAPFIENGISGINVYNCCGSFDIGVRAETTAKDVLSNITKHNNLIARARGWSL